MNGLSFHVTSVLIRRGERWIQALTDQEMTSKNTVRFLPARKGMMPQKKSNLLILDLGLLAAQLWENHFSCFSHSVCGDFFFFFLARHRKLIQLGGWILSWQKPSNFAICQRQGQYLLKYSAGTECNLTGLNFYSSKNVYQNQSWSLKYIRSHWSLTGCVLLTTTKVISAEKKTQSQNMHEEFSCDFKPMPSHCRVKAP